MKKGRQPLLHLRLLPPRRHQPPRAGLGFNKVALAHHNDDAVETFFMNLVTSGQLRTFLPVTPLSRSGITVLRPLLYYREQEIRELVAKLGLTPIKILVLMTATPCVRTSRSI